MTGGNECRCPGNGTHAHVRGCHLHPESVQSGPNLLAALGGAVDRARADRRAITKEVRDD